jgi:hypothetical protein
MASSPGSSWSWECQSRRLLPQGGVLFPFFAATPGHARALLEDAFRRQSAETLNVTVTDDAPLTGVLRSAGAKVKMEILELQGPLR